MYLRTALLTILPILLFSSKVGGAESSQMEASQTSGLIKRVAAVKRDDIQIKPVDSAPLTRTADGAVTVSINKSTASVNSPVPILNFESEGETDLENNVSTAAGGNWIVVIRGAQINTFDRSGERVFTGLIWNNAQYTPAFNEPRLQFDRKHKRWVMSGYEQNPEAYLIGISTTEDPRDPWNFYSVEGARDFEGDEEGAQAQIDMPALSINSRWIAVQGSITGSDGTNGPRVANRAELVLVDKLELYASHPSPSTIYVPALGSVSVPEDPQVVPRLVSNQDDDEADVFVWSANFQQGYLNVWKFGGSPGQEASSGPIVVVMSQAIAVATGYGQQPGSTNLISLGPDRHSAVVKNGQLWLASMWGAQGSDKNAIHWWNLTKQGTQIQSGTVKDPTGQDDFGFVRIAVNRYGDVMLGHTLSGPNRYLSSGYSFRYAFDHPGTFRNAVITRIGSNDLGYTRVADYTETALDTDDVGFWTTNMFASTYRIQVLSLDEKTWKLQTAHVRPSTRRSPGTDFSGDGKGDILIRNTTTGENYLYPMDGKAILPSEGYIRTVDTAWTVGGIGDFNGDGKADVLWRNGTTGENYVHFMDGKTILPSEGYIRTVPTAWTVGGIGDFNGDGKADILWRNGTTGENYIYFMDGKTILPSEGFIRTVPTAWTVNGVGDFNGDGKADILWRNGATGENYIYFMDGKVILSSEGYFRTVVPAWVVAGTGDFDGDGKSDILWRNTTTGENYLYFMDGRTIKPTEGAIRTVTTSWIAASVADFDGDGKDDILWRNTSAGENYIYFIDGRTIKSNEGYIRSTPLSWTVLSK